MELPGKAIQCVNEDETSRRTAKKSRDTNTEDKDSKSKRKSPKTSKDKKKAKKRKKDPDEFELKKSEAEILTTKVEKGPNDVSTSSELKQGTSSKIDRGDESSDDDDDDLLAAAAAWADKGDDNKNGTSESSHRQTLQDDTHSIQSSPPQSLSLHITQLPFDANELDIRQLLATKATITSVRLVYDKDDKGRKTVFRGVAFVDVIDRASFDNVLTLNHKASIRGRKLNIRPTRTKHELADIVSKRSDLVQAKIRKAVDKKKLAASGGTMSRRQQLRQKAKVKKAAAMGKTDDDKAKRKITPKTKALSFSSKTPPRDKGRTMKSSSSSKQNKPSTATSVNEANKKEKHKLTKKERNRRAAILARRAS